MSYTHLTISERSKIETYLELGYSIHATAKQLHRSPSTISRELRRHQNCTIEEAQTRYQANKSNCGAKHKLTDELKKAVQEKLGERWSPEQIVGRLYAGKLSFRSIYRWIYDGLLEVPLTVTDRIGLCPSFTYREQPIFSSNNAWTNRVFCRIIIDFNLPIV